MKCSKKQILGFFFRTAIMFLMAYSTPASSAPTVFNEFTKEVKDAVEADILTMNTGDSQRRSILKIAGSSTPDAQMLSTEGRAHYSELARNLRLAKGYFADYPITAEFFERIDSSNLEGLVDKVREKVSSGAKNLTSVFARSNGDTGHYVSFVVENDGGIYFVDSMSGGQAQLSSAQSDNLVRALNAVCGLTSMGPYSADYHGDRVQLYL